MKAAIAALLLFVAPGASAEETSLASLEFLVGDWRGANGGLVIEESWSLASAGVITGVARGFTGAGLNFLRYTIIEENAGSVIMRFKHYGADYSTREKDGPAALRLVGVGEGSATFEAGEAAGAVRRILYRSPAEDVLEAVVDRDDAAGEPGVFQFSLTRAD